MLRVATICLACLLFTADAWSQEKTKPFDTAQRLAKIEAALASEASLEFHETPLDVVLQHLSLRYEIPFTLDQSALDLLGLSSDQPISMEMKSVRLQDGLTLMLRDLDLDWMIWNGVIEVTSPEQAQSHLTTVVYDVSELYHRDPLDAGAVHYQPSAYADVTGLISLITRTTEPESWEELGGPATIETWHNGEKDLLIIRQTWRMHQAIGGFLDKLKEHAPKNKPAAKEDAVSTKLYVVPQDSPIKAEELVKIVQLTLEDADWREKRSITAVANVLVVKQTAAVQHRVERLLVSLNAVIQYETLVGAMSSANLVGRCGTCALLGPPSNASVQIIKQP